MNEMNSSQAENEALFDVAEPPRERQTRNRLLYACGCLGILGIIACIAFGGISYYALQQPEIIVTMWVGSVADPQNAETSDFSLCDGSQAEQFTQSWVERRIEIDAFDMTRTLDDNTIRVDANTIQNGDLGFWSADFVIIDGGTFGKCIDQIIEPNNDPS